MKANPVVGVAFVAGRRPLVNLPLRKIIEQFWMDWTSGTEAIRARRRLAEQPHIIAIVAYAHLHSVDMVFMHE